MNSSNQKNILFSPPMIAVFVILVLFLAAALIPQSFWVDLSMKMFK